MFGLFKTEFFFIFFIYLEPPNSLDLDGSHPRRIKLTAPNINLSLDQSEGSILSDDNLDTPDEIDINVDDLDTPDEADSFEYATHGNELLGKGKTTYEVCFLHRSLTHSEYFKQFLSA